MIAELLVANGFATAVFSGLAASDEYAAHQKSAITQALRSVFSAPSAFIEEDSRWDASLEPDKIHHRVFLRCIDCPAAPAHDGVSPESVQYSSSSAAGDVFTLFFETVPSAQKWKVAGKVERLSFASVTTKTIPAGSTVAASDVQIVACSTIRRCQTATSFDTHRDALMFATSLSGMIARRSLANGKVLVKDDFTAPLAVKRGAEVNVVLSSESGLQIVARAVALESGSVGNTIQLRLMGDSRSRPSANAQVVMGLIGQGGEIRYEK